MRSFLIAAALAVGLTHAPQAFSAVGYLDCGQERGTRSQNGDAATSITFRAVGENDETQFKIYWLDYQGKRVFYKHIFAGDVYQQPTYMTHPWVVTAPEPGGGELCIGIYFPDSAGSAITLD